MHPALGQVRTVAGGVTAGYRNGPCSHALFSQPDVSLARACARGARHCTHDACARAPAPAPARGTRAHAQAVMVTDRGWVLVGDTGNNCVRLIDVDSRAV